MQFFSCSENIPLEVDFPDLELFPLMDRDIDVNRFPILRYCDLWLVDFYLDVSVIEVKGLEVLDIFEGREGILSGMSHRSAP